MKLYKYRSIKSEVFPYYLESLKDGYLWFADVLSLNDKSDSIIYYGKEQDFMEFKQYYDEHELESVQSIVNSFVPNKNIKDSLSKVPNDKLLEMIKILKKSDNEIKEYLISNGGNNENINKFF